MRGPVQHADPRKLRREPVGHLARAVGRVVVDHENASRRDRVPRRRGRARGRSVRGSRARCTSACRWRGARGISSPGCRSRPNPPRGRGCRATRSSPSGSSSSPTCSSWTGPTPSVSSAYRRAATRIRESAAPVARLAIDGTATQIPGDRRHDRGEDRRARRRQATSVRSRSSATRSHRGSSRSCTCPASARRRPVASGRSSAIKSMDDLRAAAEAQRAPRASGPRAEDRGARARCALRADPRTEVDTGRVLLGRVLPVLRAVVAELAQHPACDRVSEAGSVRRACRDDARRRPDRDLLGPGGAHRSFRVHPRVAEVAAQGPTKATVVSYDGLRFDLRVVPPESYGNLLQHFTGSKDHNVALREDAVRRGLSVSEYGIEDVETGEVHTAEDEEAVYERLGYAVDPAGASREPGRARGRAATASCPISSSSPTSRATSTCTRPGRTAAETLEEMVAAATELGSSLRRDLRPREAAARRPARASDARRSTALNEQLDGLDDPHSASRSTSSATGRSTSTTRRSRERDWVMASIHSGFDAPRARGDAAARGRDGEPARRLHRPPDGPEAEPPRAVRSRPRARCSRRRSRPARSSRSTRSRTGSTSRTSTRARRVEAGVKIVVSTDAHQRPRSSTNLELGVVQARRGLAHEGRRREHAHRGRRSSCSLVAKSRSGGERFRDDLRRADRRGRVGGALPRDHAGAARCVPPVEPGEVRAQLPASPPEEAEPFEAVLRDLDEIVVPGITHWNHPRFFAYFAITGSEPGILAELLSAAFNVNAMLWRTGAGRDRARGGRARLARGSCSALPEGLHGHIEDTASTSTLAALAAARELRPGGAVLCSEHAHSSVDKAARILGLRTAARSPSTTSFGCGRTRSRSARRRRRGRGRRDRRDDVHDLGRSRPRDRRSVRAARRLAPRGRGLRGLGGGLPELRWALDGVERADSLVVNPHKWLFTPVDCSRALHAPAGGPPRRLQPRSPSTCAPASRR